MGLKASMRILVVDDMSSMRKVIKTMLGQIGFKNIDEADDGSSAWDMLQKAAQDQEPYKFVISDWSMTKVSGLELLKLVRGTPATKDLPFLMVGGEAEQGNVVIAAKAGVNNFIVKPFSALTLKEKIEKIFIKK